MNSSYQFAADKAYLSTSNTFWLNIGSSSLRKDFIFSDMGSSNIKGFNSLLSIAVALDIADIIFPAAFLTMIASEKILKKDWDTIEEDLAWADL